MTAKQKLTMVEMVETEGAPTTTQITSEYSRAEVMDRLIAQFGLERRFEQPPVTTSVPPELVMVLEPQYQLRGSILHIRHPGLGWMMFKLSAAQRADLAGKLAP